MLIFSSRAVSCPRPWPLTSLMLAVALAGCASVSKPPGVDESTRRPVNDPARVELLRTQAEGDRAGIDQDLQRRSSEARRVADALQTAAAMPLPGAPSAVRGAQVYTALFARGSARLTLPAPERERLVQAAKAAPLVVVRGRTDADQDNPADSRLARERAQAMQALLLDAGVAPERIRLQYQGAGDQVADNQTPAGRALNRRVEVEVYTSVPAAATLGSAADPVAGAASPARVTE
jgi:outer membrane protein OmpA-like peptidoglycan-associated protein